MKLFKLNQVFIIISYNGIIKYAINCYVIKEYIMYKKTGGEERIGERPSKAKGAMLSGNAIDCILSCKKI